MIRQATIQDYEAINKIKETLLLDYEKITDPVYRVKTQLSGFFVYKKPQTIDEFSKDLQKIHLVHEQNGIVNGYVRIDEKQEMVNDTDLNVTWFKPEMRDVYFRNPHAALAGIGLLPETAKKGNGKNLLQTAIENVTIKKIPYLFAFVVLSPMTNIASLLFHERNDFERIASCTASELFGFTTFQSFLYAKKL